MTQISDGRLAGKVALITGTGSGQGRVAALTFAREGALVVGCDLTVDGAAETEQLAAAAGTPIRSFQPVDLADEGAVTRWVRDAVDVHGRIDVLYNNAGAVRFGAVESQSLDDWRFTIRNEIDIVFLAIKHCWPHLAAHGGSIINIASTAGLAGSMVLGRSAHSAAKGGIIAMTKQVAAEGARSGIRCNAISPGVVVTPQSRAAILDNPDHPMAGIARLVPLRRLADPEDVVMAALYLASDDSSYVTGANLVVDGGLSAVLPGE